MLFHASFVAALYVIPMSTTQRFAQSGDTRVVTIEAFQDRPSPISEFLLEQLPLTSTLDSPLDRMVTTESIEPRELTDSLDEPQLGDFPGPSLPAFILELPIDRELMLRRRPTEATAPQVAIADTPQRKPRTRPVAEPPAAAAIPIEQFVGLEKESAADLSSNRPPAYPLAAVHQRLEGVVLLQLTIRDDGMVDEVTIIKSSGHEILDDAAIDSVRKWTAQPARRWGRAVESVERLPIRFRL